MISKIKHLLFYTDLKRYNKIEGTKYLFAKVSTFYSQPIINNRSSVYNKSKIIFSNYVYIENLNMHFKTKNQIYFYIE